MPKRRIHLVAPAGSARPFFEKLHLLSGEALIAHVGDIIGPSYSVTGDAALMEAHESELHGGRTDDAQRACDIETALRDDEVAAIVALRGGAWLSRILPLVDFSVLDGRSNRVAMIGFSEMTTLVNLVGAHPNGLGVYDMSPGFLAYGLRRYAARHDNELPPGVSPEAWASARVQVELAHHMRHVVAMIEGHEQVEPIPARLVRGSAPRAGEAVFVGGNLTVFSTLVGSRYESDIAPAGKWLVLEDFNDKLERFDRLLSHLTLAGYWDRCEGILLGDFHQGARSLVEPLVNVLDYHVGAGRALPVLVTRHVGHIWPMSPLPLHQPLRVSHGGGDTFHLDWPAALTQVV